ncbi:unnamed protein product [Prorocentrum cordatum]|uniref:Centrosomal protein of 70 kDa n=2 Tax=Prorocentrum cordatum TaxID=2364126 RepID=A0ABN9WAE7_9DINO|nr:unnamed protein product [Polarella glacialis]
MAAAAECAASEEASEPEAAALGPEAEEAPGPAEEALGPEVLVTKENKGAEEFGNVARLEITYVDPVLGDIKRRQAYCDPKGGKWIWDARFLVSANLVNLLSDTMATRHARNKALHENLSNIRTNNLVSLYRLRQHLERLHGANQHAARRDTAQPDLPQTARFHMSSLVSESRNSSVDLGESATWPVHRVGQEASPFASPKTRMSPSASPKSRPSPSASPKSPPRVTARQQSASDVTAPAEEEVGPVHFYLSESYLEEWTLELFGRALKAAQADLSRECKAIQARIRTLGGGTWRQLLDMILDKGDKSLEELLKTVLDMISDGKDRFDIENAVSKGMRGHYDNLLPKIQDLESQVSHYEETCWDLDSNARQLRMANDRLELAKRDLGDYLEAAAEHEPPEDQEAKQLEEQERLTDAQEKVLAQKRLMLFEESAQRLAAMKEAQERAEAALERDEQDLLNEKRLDEEPGVTPGELQRKVRVHEIRIDKLWEKRQTLREELSEYDARLEEKAQAVTAAEEKLASYARPPDDRALRLQKMKRTLAKVQKSQEKARESMVKPIQAVRAIRYQLRGLHRKLGLDWDFSDSDGDDESKLKPYWERRKLASGGLAPFDPHLFLAAEEAYFQRRCQARESTFRDNTQSLALTQLEAKRRLTLGASLEVQQQLAEQHSLSQDALSSTEGGPSQRLSRGPFADDHDEDSVMRAMGNMRRLLLPRDSEVTAWAEAPDQSPLEFARLQAELRAHLQSCAVILSDLLPPDAKFGRPRMELARMLEGMQSLPEDPTEPEEREACRCLADAAGCLWGLFWEASAGPEPVALPPSPEVDELRLMLEWASCDVDALKLATGATVGALRREASPGPGAVSPPAPPPRSPPRAPHQPLESLLRGAGLSHSRRGGRHKGPQGADFGFRPDGGAEESLEKWSLFKVSKNPSPTRDGAGAAGRPEPGRDAAGRAKEDPKAQRYLQLAGNSDFRDYVSGLAAKDEWKRATRAQPLPPKAKKGGPSKSNSLPQLVRKAPGGQQALALPGLTTSRSRSTIGIDAA